MNSHVIFIFITAYL